MTRGPAVTQSRSQKNMTKISVNEVTKKYADHIALDHMCIDIPKQCIYGLLGPNGAGKTTLIRILNQITAPDSGEVRIDGEMLNQRHIARIGYLPEERGLYKKMKVGEQAIYLAELKGIKKAEAQKRLKTWFDKFEIGGWWDKKVEELSKGMQQKVQFITTVIHEPEILIFDEPFSGFDPINANLLKEAILELRDKGATILLSTHNMASVEELCDNIALINKSHLVITGGVDEIRHKYGNNNIELIKSFVDCIESSNHTSFYAFALHNSRKEFHLELKAIGIICKLTSEIAKACSILT